MNRFHILLLTICAMSSIQNSVTGDETVDKQKAAKLEASIPITMGYLLYLPKDYEKQDAWPLLMFLHGAGERGDDLELVKVHGPPKLIKQGKDFPFIVVSPQCPKDKGWEAVELTALLDDVIKNHKVDKDRIYITGLSMGGFGTWRLAAAIPDRIAAIVPICGGGETISIRQIRNIPTWAFHGAKDNVVTLDRTTKMIDALKAAGANPKLTVYPEAGHDSWTETYNNPELYDWLLAQKRNH
jgi:predicted peptidase